MFEKIYNSCVSYLQRHHLDEPEASSKEEPFKKVAMDALSAPSSVSLFIAGLGKVGAMITDLFSHKVNEVAQDVLRPAPPPRPTLLAVQPTVKAKMAASVKNSGSLAELNEQVVMAPPFLVEVYMKQKLMTLDAIAYYAYLPCWNDTEKKTLTLFFADPEKHIVWKSGFSVDEKGYLHSDNGKAYPSLQAVIDEENTNKMRDFIPLPAKFNRGPFDRNSFEWKEAWIPAREAACCYNEMREKGLSSDVEMMLLNKGDDFAKTKFVFLLGSAIACSSDLDREQALTVLYQRVENQPALTAALFVAIAHDLNLINLVPRPSQEELLSTLCANLNPSLDLSALVDTQNKDIQQKLMNSWLRAENFIPDSDACYKLLKQLEPLDLSLLKNSYGNFCLQQDFIASYLADQDIEMTHTNSLIELVRKWELKKISDSFICYHLRKNEIEACLPFVGTSEQIEQLLKHCNKRALPKEWLQAIWEKNPQQSLPLYYALYKYGDPDVKASLKSKHWPSSIPTFGRFKIGDEGLSLLYELKDCIPEELLRDIVSYVDVSSFSKNDLSLLKQWSNKYRTLKLFPLLFAYPDRFKEAPDLYKAAWNHLNQEEQETYRTSALMQPGIDGIKLILSLKQSLTQKELEECFSEALSRQSPELLKNLLPRIKDINAPLGISGKTPLQLAAADGLVELSQMLLEHGAQADNSIIKTAMDQNQWDLVFTLRPGSSFPDLLNNLLEDTDVLKKSLKATFLNSSWETNERLWQLLEEKFPREGEQRAALNEIKLFAQQGGSIITRPLSKLHQNMIVQLYGKKTVSYEEQQFNYGAVRWIARNELLELLKEKDCSLLQLYFQAGRSRTKMAHSKGDDWWRLNRKDLAFESPFRAKTHYGVPFHDKPSHYTPYLKLVDETFRQTGERKDRNCQITFTSSKGQVVPVTRISPRDFEHTDSHSSLEALIEEASLQFEEIKTMEKSDPLLQKRIAFIYWLLCHGCLLVKGSSQVNLELHSALLEHHGFSVRPTQKLPLPDCVALSTTFENFYDNYYHKIFDIR